jgi:sigma-E factor negative regulatory protein RseC
MEATVRVVSVTGPRARVTCDDRASCSACGSGGGCALRWFASSRRAALEIPACADDRQPLQPGDTVVLSIGDGELLRAAALAYLPPLLGLLAGAIAARVLGGASDGVALAAGLAGAVAGWWSSRTLARRKPPRFAISLAAGDPL